MVAISYLPCQVDLTPASVSSHQVDIQSFHFNPPSEAAISKPVSNGGQNLVNHLQQKKDENRRLAWSYYWAKPPPPPAKPTITAEQSRAMQLQMIDKDKQLRIESSQLLKEVTAVDWEQAKDKEIQEAMTKYDGWRKNGDKIMRDFRDNEEMLSQYSPEYENLKVYMKDFLMQLSKACMTVWDRDNVRDYAELLAKEAARDVSRKAELEVPKTLIWEAKPEVHMEEKLEIKNEDSVFFK